ncbi:phenylalanine--tRNA ligase subunit beta [Geothrix rubra]|uniref:phenylalanine--tRNA ligase n=1 Tax=Geothrix rubra TaxID=2927977 RepID=A0ABQ5Q7W1_9BACT|nr:phenylalanine--tRNA ligase subunit beta [Geothrix rubra]GLH70885.1 phenylalanine--tRNA ligase subunit beta [Geothrix rubra]
MWIEREALAAELPAAAALATRQLAETLASLGFPVDAVEHRPGTEVLDVDITANRGDAMSHRGLARDLAARLQQPLAPLAPPPVTEGEPRIPVSLPATACPLYATALLTLGEGRTPEAVQAFLLALGSTPKLLPAVDASNELLHRYGHPTHAFDADRIRGAVSVRMARSGETLVTLDGVTRKLTLEDLVIADEAGPIALAGVMGGDGTKVTEATRRVLLESAWFEPRVVRAAAHRHGLHTDASQRFGRGADPAMATVARDLLVQRLQDWAGATLEGAWTAGKPPAPPAPVDLPKDVLTRVAGEPLLLAEAAKALKALGCVVEAEPGHLRVEPPSWRHDLTLAEDLAEEVLRLRGYEHIPSVLPSLEGPPQPLSQDYLHRQALARRLAHLGFHQTVTYGFVSPEMDAAFPGPQGEAADDDRAGRTLANPLGLEYSILRRSLVPSLVEVARRNLQQGQREVRLFEIAPTFRGLSRGPAETWTVSLLWAGERWDADPESKAGPVRAKHLLGILKDVLKPTSQEVAIHPLEGGTFLAAEFPVQAFRVPDDRIIPTFTPHSRFPAVERDLSLVVPAALAWQAMHDTVRGALAGTALVALACADLYQGKHLPAGTKAWLLRLTFQAMDRTLVGAEVDAWVAGALAAAESLGAALRA